ncbi:hypothetical protein BJV82DRAFT_632914 [Fennellomyces sp. T-0311]|nr:hypothetical protein BJV82DRAFT_632914 [Fennellomyces sp. T-0311]
MNAQGFLWANLIVITMYLRLSFSGSTHATRREVRGPQRRSSLSIRSVALGRFFLASSKISRPAERNIKLL